MGSFPTEAWKPAPPPPAPPRPAPAADSFVACPAQSRAPRALAHPPPLPQHAARGGRLAAGLPGGAPRAGRLHVVPHLHGVPRRPHRRALLRRPPARHRPRAGRPRRRFPRRTPRRLPRRPRRRREARRRRADGRLWQSRRRKRLPAGPAAGGRADAVDGGGIPGQRHDVDRGRRVGVAAEPAEHRRDDGVLPAAADRRAGGAGRGAVGGLHPAVAVDCLGGHRQRQRRRVLLRRRRGRAGGPPEPPQVHPRVHVRLRRPAGHRRGHQLPSDRPGAPGRGRGRTREALAAPAACLHPKWRVLFS